MKHLKSVALTMLGALSLSASAAPAIPRDANLEKQVEETVARMTLDEKIGQMLELSIDVIGKQDFSNGKLTWSVDETKLEELIRTFKPGSFLNAPMTTAPTVEQWQQYIPKIQELSMKYIGIPTLYGLDNNHGVTYVQAGTMFPQPINLAASFNTDLAKDGAVVTAYESRAADCPWVYNPTTDLGRDPRWPRIWESFGEDALVNARMAVAQIKGYQGDDPNHLSKYNVAACLKHYMCYGAPWTGKDRTPAYLSEQQIREKYFEPFRSAIQAGALSIMVNSGSINGEPVHASYKYLTQWLKNDLEWDGMIVTDWADIDNLFSREHVAVDKKDAIRIAINAGIDMTMDPYSPEFCTLLKELVAEGKVSEERIDDACRRILRLKYRLNLFKEPNTGGKDFKDFGSAKSAALALEAAIQSEVLLKNNGILPLARDKKILLAGPNANSMRSLNGGWTYTWQGSKAEAFSEQYNTVYEALCNKYGADNVILQQGVTYNEEGQYYEENAPDIAAAVNAAANADVIVACVGENSYTETPGNLSDLWLSENQRNLVKELAKTGKPIILVLNEGRPRLITDIEPLASAVVNVLLPGNYGGDALAELLAGDANFSARLPYTYPAEINSLHNYDHKVSEVSGTMAGSYNYDAKISQLWPFGYGLSYTTFEYSNLRTDITDFSVNDEIKVTVDVKNTGKAAGMEAVLLYSSDLVASLVPDNRRLRDFTKISLEPGETKTVTFSLPAKSLAFVGKDTKWTLEEGDFMLHIANLHAPLRCTSTYVWDTPNM